MEKRVIITALLIAMLSVVFSMSGDGGNVPVVQKENNTEPLQQASVSSGSVEQAKSNDTIKDKFGIDTDMSRDELFEFKTQYMKKAEELGILKYPTVSPQTYFEHKVNLNSVEELKKLGLFLTKDPFLPDESFAYSITHSDVIVIGTIDSVEYFYNTEAEEWKSHILSRYYVKVDKILKGNEYYKNAPETITYFSSNGRFLTSGDFKPKTDKKYVLFFQKLDTLPKEYSNDLCKIHTATFRIEGTKIYRDISDKEYVKSYNEILSILEKYQKINDINNFFKRQYMGNCKSFMKK